jgi:AraC-like DNA-binding protein
MATDPAAAAAFYRSVVGRRVQDAGMPDRSHTILSVAKTQMDGLMAIFPRAREIGARPGWNGYVAVDDVDAAAARQGRGGRDRQRSASGSDLPIGQVATRTGFESAPTFRDRFSRIVGVSPTAYRKAFRARIASARTDGGS